jgi:hypothetical protein
VFKASCVDALFGCPNLDCCLRWAAKASISQYMRSVVPWNPMEAVDAASSFDIEGPNIRAGTPGRLGTHTGPDGVKRECAVGRRCLAYTSGARSRFQWTNTA